MNENPHDESARLFALGNQLRNSGRLEEAVGAYQRAIELAPNYTAAFINLGTVHAMRNSWDEAAAAYRQAVALAPNIPVVQYNFSNALEAACLWDEALLAAQRGVQMLPNDASMRHHLGVALYNLGRLDEAMDAYQTAIQMQPDLALAHCDLAYLLMIKGDLLAGWREYEWRWRAVEPGRLHPRFTDQTKWDGADPARRRIILHNEGGHGDSLRYFRYAPIIAKRGGRVIVRCQAPLVRLFQTLQGVEQVVPADQAPPEFDFHCPIFSLPRVMGTTLENIPANVPYLHAEPEKAARWKSRMAAGRMNVGLVWAGSPVMAHDRTRSLKLADFAPLARNGVRFYSLQKGAAAGQSTEPPARMELIDCSAELPDWTDTAGLLANLDLLISADTAPAHLAGAMGRPVWVPLQFMPDPPWLLERLDTPWYPTMRLFRQERHHDWVDVVNRMAAELGKLVDGNVR